MAFGINNTIIPPAAEVNTTDFNTIALVGIAPKGPAQQLVVCGSDTDDSQFGKCLTGFNIPLALAVIRQSGAGKVVVVNTFNIDSHTSQVTAESGTVVSQKTKTAFNPIDEVGINNGDGIDAVDAAAAVANLAVTTGIDNVAGAAATSELEVTVGASAGNTLATLKLGGIDLLAGTLTFVGGDLAATSQEIVDAINAFTGTSGFSATQGTGGVFTITAPVSAGSGPNGLSTVIGTIVGAVTIVTNTVYSGGVTEINFQIQNGDTLASLKVGLVDLLSGTLTFTGGNDQFSAGEIVDAINGFTGTSGFSATNGTGGAFTITGPVASGASINGVITTIGSLSGDPVIGVNEAFADGVDPVDAVDATDYVKDTDYTIDEYGNVIFLIAMADETEVFFTYKKLNASAVNAATIIGTVSGSTRTGCKLLDACQTLLKLVPKILIIPGYNTLSGVKVEMDRLCSEWRMRTFYGSTTGLTKAQAISSRGPAGPLATFNTSNKRAILAFPKIKVFDPQSGGLILDDPSAALAGFMSFCAATLGPHESTSNREVPAVLGTEIDLIHKWEDASSAADTNQLRSAGIACIFSDGGFKWWGAENASFPDNTAVDQNICVIYVNDIITDSLTRFATQYIDRNITTGTIASFITEANKYYSSLMTAGWIGKSSQVRFIKSRNPDADLQAGKVRFTRNTFYFVGMKFIEVEENMEVQLPTV